MLTYPEKAILFNGCQLEPGKRSADAIKEAIKSSPRWGLLLEEAYKNGVHCLLYHNLKDLDLLKTMPPELKMNFECNYLLHSAKQERLYNEFRKLLIELTSRGIVPLMLKAASLSHSIYKDITLRPSSDLDFVVRQDDWEEVVRLMPILGYKPVSPLDVDFFEITYEKIDNPQIVVEISTCLSEIQEYEDSIMPDVKEIWGRARDINVMGVSVKALSLEDELCFLISHHLTTHYLLKLIWLCDIVEYIKAYNNMINWDTVIENVNHQRQETAFSLAVLLSRQVADIETAIPVKKRPGWILENIYDNNRLRFIEEGYLRQRKNLIRLLLIDGMQGKAGFILKRMFPSYNWLQHRYPEVGFKDSYLTLFLYHQYSISCQFFKMLRQFVFNLPSFLFRSKQEVQS